MSIEWEDRKGDVFQARIGKEYVGSVYYSQPIMSWIAFAMNNKLGFYPNRTEAQDAVEERFVK